VSNVEAAGLDGKPELLPFNSRQHLPSRRQLELLPDTAIHSPA